MTGTPADQAVWRVRRLHQRYRSPLSETDCCAHCNQLTGGLVPWPCPTMQALDGTTAAAKEQPPAGARQDGAGS